MWPPAEPPLGLKLFLIQLRKDERGVTILLAALLLSVLSVSLAMVIDIGAIALRREQLTTMVEAGAAAGGGEVAEAIATRASERTGGRALSADEAAHPERFLDESDRAAILTSPELISAVKISGQKIIAVNLPAAGSKSRFDLNSLTTIEYPARTTDCTSSDTLFAVVKASAQAKYYPLLGGLIALFSGDGSLPLQKDSYYRIRLCP